LIEENKITVGRASVDETVSENEKKPEFEEIKELVKRPYQAPREISTVLRS